MTSTIKEHLIAARALIDTPEKWSKDIRGGSSCYCAIIATNRIAGGMNEAKEAGLWRALYDALPFVPDQPMIRRGHDWSGVEVGDFNDDPTTTHADIMALFDRAIAAQEPSHAG